MGMDHPAFTLGAICSIGGVMGYAKRKSVPSLVAGLTVGSLYFYSSYLLKQNADYGLETAVGASALLLAGVLPRAVKTRKGLPIGLVILATTSLGYFGQRWADFNL